MPTCKYLNKFDQSFNNHGKFIIIQQQRNICTTSTETGKEILKQEENVWIMKPRPKLKPCYAEFLFTTILPFCRWFRKTGISCKMMSHTLQCL